MRKVSYRIGLRLRLLGGDRRLRDDTVAMRIVVVYMLELKRDTLICCLLGGSDRSKDVVEGEEVIHRNDVGVVYRGWLRMLLKDL